MIVFLLLYGLELDEDGSNVVDNSDRNCDDCISGGSYYRDVNGIYCGDRGDGDGDDNYIYIYGGRVDDDGNGDNSIYGGRVDDGDNGVILVVVLMMVVNYIDGSSDFYDDIDDGKWWWGNSDNYIDVSGRGSDFW